VSKLFIRLPSHATMGALPPGSPLYCPFAWVSERNAVEREGVAALSEMGELVKQAQRVVLIVAAPDVTLLRVKVPPLSGARLKAALPNMVEDQLMSDPAECAVVAGELHEGLRTVGVVQRSWLEILSKTLLSLGARRIAALPAQLCLAHQTDAVTAAVAEHGADIDVTVRLAEQQGIGLSILADQPESAAFEVIQSLNAVVPQAQVVLHVPQSRLRDYQDCLHLVPALEQRITLQADNWAHWVSGASLVAMDLMSGLGGAGGAPRLEWQRWRWPAALAAALLLVNILGLNVDWLRMQREAEALRASMVQNYRAAFPQDTVIVDPLIQARQKRSASQNASGALANDDFLALTAALAEAWSAVGQGPAPIAGLDYRERTLTVRMKPGAGFGPDQWNTALAARNLAAQQQGEGVWQIRSAR
jgi:general secretion pathway protein L